MRPIVSVTAVFALVSVLLAVNTPAAPLAWEDNKTAFSSSPDRPIFSSDMDIYLGQRRRFGDNGRIWSNAYYGGTTIKPSGGGKIRPNFYGLQLGIDRAKLLGYSTFFLNVNQSKINFGSDSSKIDNYLLGYGKYVYLKGCHFALMGSVGYDRYEISSGKTHTGDGLQSNFFGEFGLDVPFGSWKIKPFYALQYDFLYHGDIGEPSAVLVKDWNDHGVEQLCGLRLNWQVTELLELQSRAVWVHEMLDNPPPFYHARFSPVLGINTPAIMYYGGSTGRDWAWLGIGGKLELIFKAYFDYDVLFNERHITHIGSLGLCFVW